MGRHCAAVGCVNDDRKPDCRGKTFFRFPVKNKSLLKEWEGKVKRLNFVPSPYSHLCSDHFEDECFTFQPFTNVRLLKPNSVPTKFAHLTPKTPRRKLVRPEIDHAQKKRLTNELPSESLESEDMNVASTSYCQSSQTSHTFTSIIDELYVAGEEVMSLRKMIAEKDFSPNNVPDDSKMKAVTGLSKDIFFMIFRFLCLDAALGSSDGKLSAVNKFFLFMVKLRTGISNEFLSILFSVSDSSVSRYFNIVASVMYFKLKSINIWPSRNQVWKNMQKCFLQHFDKCRVIIDCTEIKIQKPYNPLEQQLTFSTYKNANTLKSLIGICPSGEISFISDLYCGSISDKEIFNRCGIVEMLDHGDLVMADKGFLIQKELNNIGCSLVTPCYLKDKIQFSVEERGHNYRVSNMRIHVERAIGRVKVFKYFEGAIPYSALHNVNEIFFIVSMLTNFGSPLIKNL